MKRFCLSFLSTVLVLAAALPASAAPATRPLRSVGLTVGDLGNPFFVQVAKGAEAKVRELGGPGVKFSAVSSNYDLNQQTNQLEDFIAAKVDLIVLNAADTKGIAPMVKKARAAGIIVVAVDVAAEGGVSATVMSDNLQAGRLAAEFLAAKLGGKGEVAIINGPPVSAVMDRVRGAEEVFRRHPGIRVVSRDQNAGGNRMGGMNVATDLLTANPQLAAIFAINDPTGLGAALAIRQARRDQVFVVGVDGAPDAEKALRDGKSAFLATAAQDPFAMAAKAVEVGVGLLQGRAPAADPLLVPVSLVTRETVGQYKGWTAK
ncbi:ABC transporter substrate-binding protein [Horticoccus sp. 23ND18S-11]|uniref:ABC transporter substrate-binding protein n=1 Tax=Horticoccus sp. 23ND18S-11 TaxID=3391832 RepID=UPI0039C93994